MKYEYKIWISLHFSWIWRMFGYCGHIDTCQQTKLRDSCTRYEVPHNEDDWTRFVLVSVLETGEADETARIMSKPETVTVIKKIIKYAR